MFLWPRDQTARGGTKYSKGEWVMDVTEVSGEDITRELEQFGSRAKKMPFDDRLQHLNDKIIAIAKDLGPLSKDSRNDSQHYSFLSTQNLMTRLQPILHKHGVVGFQSAKLLNSEKYTTKSGAEAQRVVVACEILLSDGQGLVSVSALGGGADHGDKAIMKAQTAAYRECWVKLLALPIGDDPEADEKTDRGAEDDQGIPKVKRVKKTIGEQGLGSETAIGAAITDRMNTNLPPAAAVHTPGNVLIRTVKKVSGVSKNTGKPWTRYDVNGPNDRLITFEPGIGEVLMQLKGQTVAIQTEGERIMRVGDPPEQTEIPL
jgi:hypothetical protein